MVSTSSEKTAFQRAPRKRVVKKAAPEKSTVSLKEKVTNSEVSKKRVETKRRAPTELSASRTVRQNKRNHKIIMVMIFALGIGLSAAIGYTDQGQIDVEKTIQARNDRIQNNQASEDDLISGKVQVPVQDTSKRQEADGGLRGLGTGGVKPKPLPPPTVATSTASSTDTTASSTEAVATSTEEVVNEQVEELISTTESEATIE